MLGTFAVLFALLAVSPHNRADWLLENVLVLATLPVLIWAHLRRLLSAASYWMIFVFFCLHEIGSHYTYSEVPYDAWWQSVTGSSFNELLGLERNHYDRLIHLLFGALIFRPVREAYVASTGQSGVWSYVITISLLATLSSCYELIEWQAALIFGGDLGAAYAGTQGDVWDAHQDMAWALLGSVIAAILVSGEHTHGLLPMNQLKRH